MTIQGFTLSQCARHLGPFDWFGLCAAPSTGAGVLVQVIGEASERATLAALR